MASDGKRKNLDTSQRVESSTLASIDHRACRLCGSALKQPLIDLGLSPLCENIVRADDLNRGEMFYPLRAFVCQQCWLIQLHELVDAESIYSHYAYFSSNSTTWLEHARHFCDAVISRLNLRQDSFVVEIASNDGYLLKNFVQRRIPVLGVEPAANVADVAVQQGVPTLVRYFGRLTADEIVRCCRQADLIVANNVIGHVPDLNDFIDGLKHLLAPCGTVAIEIPHALNLIQKNQFDTIYQEHYSYFLVRAMRTALQRHGLTLYDAEELATHGGSIRYFAQHVESAPEVEPIVDELIAKEDAQGLGDPETYRTYSKRVQQTKWDLLEFLIEARRDGKAVVGYGAPGKAATLLNYCGIREDLMEYTVDRNTMKQGTYLVGTMIPIYAPEMLAETQPDYIVILPWNLRDEIMAQLSYTRRWGAKFVIPIPSLEVV